MDRQAAILITLLLTISGTSFGQGLKFRGLESRIEERTSFEVFAKKEMTFENELRIDFRMATFPPSRFGYILRLNDRNNPGRSWNMSYDSRGDKTVIRINEEGRRSVIYAEMEKEDFKEYSWHDISLVFDCVAGRILLSIDGEVRSADIVKNETRIRPTLYFGLSQFVVDVPSFAIKDLRIGDGHKDFIFPLDEYKGNVVHDSRGRNRGRVTNPEWLVNKAARWEHVKTLVSEVPAGVYYDPLRKEIGCYSHDRLQTFSITENTLDWKEGYGECPVNILLGMNYISSDTLVAYELSDWTERLGAPSAAALDLKTLEWKVLSRSRTEGPMHHHGGFMNKYSGKYMFFGGYNGILYNGDFYELDAEEGWRKVWKDKLVASDLYPRFFASAGTDENGEFLYIFGGMGNESGEQVVGRRYFYDLHRIDLRTGDCETLWSITPPGQDFVPARNLIVDGDCFYVLCYPEYLTTTTVHLYRFNIADGSHEVMADGINVISDKIWSSSALYLDRELGQFIVTNMNVDNDLCPVTEIHTLSYPPVPEITDSSDNTRSTAVLSLAGVIILLAITAAGTVQVRRRKNRERQKSDYLNAKVDPRKRLFRQKERPDSIYMFGDFTAIDSSGNDISGNFSKQQKVILGLLFKYYDEGLPSTRISSILWPDKEEAKVKNSRGVTINNLRKNLKQMKGISIEFSDRLYRLRLEEPFYCDYLKFIELLEKGERNESLAILSRGRFMREAKEDTFDSFKGKLEDKITPVLLEEAEKRFSNGDFRATIEIADMMFSYDSLDENALHYSVRSLLALNDKDDALLRYSNFITLYQKENGESYPIRFEKV